MSSQMQDRRPGRRILAVSGAVAAVVLGACGGPATPAPSPSASSAPSSPPSAAPTSPAGPASSPTAAPSKPASSPSTQEPVGDQVKIDISIKNGKVDPSGKKIDVPLGATVVLNVTSDSDDEIHAHTGGPDGYELEVSKGVPAQGQFTAKESGSFEIESHELDKIIVILNVR